MIEPTNPELFMVVRWVQYVRIWRGLILSNKALLTCSTPRKIKSKTHVKLAFSFKIRPQEGETPKTLGTVQELFYRSEIPPKKKQKGETTEVLKDNSPNRSQVCIKRDSSKLDPTICRKHLKLQPINVQI